ncbi:MAG TPA: hypothetical protein VFH47_03345 [Candidatus Thermoplasmatota archaeon]|nr:hypothetical protein [Candidatus Thermoplasmatota archaeon]
MEEGPPHVAAAGSSECTPAGAACMGLLGWIVVAFIVLVLLGVISVRVL